MNWQKERFSTWQICFFFSRKAFVMCYCFRAPIKTFLFDACQMTVKPCVLYLFPVPQTGRSHIRNILLASFFGPYCKLRTENSANKRYIVTFSIIVPDLLSPKVAILLSQFQHPLHAAYVLNFESMLRNK